MIIVNTDSGQNIGDGQHKKYALNIMQEAHKVVLMNHFLAWWTSDKVSRESNVHDDCGNWYCWHGLWFHGHDFHTTVNYSR